MSGSASGAPKPDPKIADAADEQVKLGREWLDFSKEQFKISSARQAQLDALTKQVTDRQLGAADLALTAANEDRERYKTVFRPIEDQFVAEASNYATPERQAEAAAEAKADVLSSSAAAKEGARRQAIGLGIKPGSGAFAGIERAGDMGTALASAGAQNQARQTVRDKGLALKADVANMGRGLPAQAAAATGLGLNAGNSAIGLEQQNQNLFNSSTGIVGNGYGGAQQGYAAQASTLGNLYNSQMSAYQADQQASSSLLGGIGSAAGMLFGGSTMPWIFSSEELKEEKAEIPEGEALEAVREMPVESWKYKEGVADEGAHVGPYAEDFQEATGRGDGTTIPLQDAVGITMKAIQDLDAKVEKLSMAVGIGPVARRADKAPTGAPPPTGAQQKSKPKSQAQPTGIGLKRAA